MDGHALLVTSGIVAALVIVITIAAGISLRLAPRTTALSLSRAGLYVKTNDTSIQFSIFDKIERIDSATKKSIRRATSAMPMIPVTTNGTETADIGRMLVNRLAIMPLIYAAYENHHTRELAADGEEAYIEDKKFEVDAAVSVLKNNYHEITTDLIDGYVCKWIRLAVIPFLKKACMEKVEYYESLLHRNDVSQHLKDEIVHWRDKNKKYIDDINALNEKSRFEDRSNSKLQSVHQGGGKGHV